MPLRAKRSSPLPRPPTVPEAMTIKTLADLRTLIGQFCVTLRNGADAGKRRMPARSIRSLTEVAYSH
jgi:hypothetical protein